MINNFDKIYKNHPQKLFLVSFWPLIFGHFVQITIFVICTFIVMKCIIRNQYTSCCHLEPPPPPPNLQKKKMFSHCLNFWGKLFQLFIFSILYKKRIYTQQAHDVFSPSITRLYYVGEILETLKRRRVSTGQWHWDCGWL